MMQKYNLTQYLPKIDSGKLSPELALVYGFLVQVASTIDNIVSRDMEEISKGNEAIADQLNETLGTVEEVLKQNSELIQQAIMDEVKDLDEEMKQHYVKTADLPNIPIQLNFTQLLWRYIKTKPWHFLVITSLLILFLPILNNLAGLLIGGLLKVTFDIDIHQVAPWLFGD